MKKEFYLFCSHENYKLPQYKKARKRYPQKMEFEKIPYIQPLIRLRQAAQPATVQHRDTHVREGEGEGLGEGLGSKGIGGLSSQMSWTHCACWAPVFLSFRLGLGQMKAKALPTASL